MDSFWWLQIWFGAESCTSSSGVLVMQADLNTSAKYPLAIVEVLLEVFGADIRGGYDIGCKFGTMLNHSELGPHAWALNYKALVGSFHGCAHNRLCQLSFLAMYVKGMGLEELKGCEYFFFEIKHACFISLLCKCIPPSTKYDWIYEAYGSRNISKPQ